MASDIKLLDGDQVLVEGADLVVDRVQAAGQEPSSVSLNLKNPTGFWHISGPRTYETGNPLSIFWNDNRQWSGAYLTINTAGNVGIGIPNPDPGYKLDVAGRMRVREANKTAGIGFYQTKPAKDQAFVGMSSDTHVGFWGSTGAGWGFLMDTTTGNVGIGTQNPGYKLDVADRMRVRQANDTAGIWFYQTKPAKDQAFVGMSTDTQVGFWGSTGADWGFVMDTTTGNVGIGTGQATPTSKLQVNGSVTANGSLTASSIRVGKTDSISLTPSSAPSSAINISNDSIELRTTPGQMDLNSGLSSLTITSKTILVKTVSKSLSMGGISSPGGLPVGGMKQTEYILDLVEEVKKLRTEVDSLNAKVKALEAAQKK